MSKQDRQGARTPADLERRYGLTGMKKSFAEVLGVSKGTSASTDRVLTELVGLKKTVQKELSKINNAIDSLPSGNTLDATRLVAINAALVENGVEAVETLDNVDEAIPAVRAAGVQSEYDRFWDVYQDYGKRVNYNGGFSGQGWTAETFYPKYNIVPTNGCYNLLYYSGFSGDLQQRIDDCGVTLDISKATILDSFMNNAFYITRIGVLDVTGAGTRTSSMFSYAFALETIDKIVVTETTVYASWFVSCSMLKNVTFEGVIGQSGMNLQWSTLLSRASIESIINALSTTTSGRSITLSATAVRNAYGASAGTDLSTYEPWTSVANTRSNWTISLV